MTSTPGDGPPQGPYPPIAYAPDHPKATTSLVLGILGIVICNVVAPFAWKIGRDTVREIDASQGRLGGRGSAQAGYVLGVIGTAILAVGVLFAVLFLALAIVPAVVSSTS